MRHALIPIALRISQSYSSGNGEDVGAGGSRRRGRLRPHPENEYPPGSPVTCFAFPVMGTAVLTPESVDRVRQRLRNVVEEVGGEERWKHRIKNFSCKGEERLGKEGEKGRMIVDELKTSEMVLVMQPCVKEEEEEEEEVLLCTGKVCYEGRDERNNSQLVTAPSPSRVLKGKVIHRGRLRQTLPQRPQNIKMTVMEREEEEAKKEVMVVDWGIPLTHRDLVSIQPASPPVGAPAEGGRTTQRPRDEGGVEGDASFVDPGRNPSFDKPLLPPSQPQEGGNAVEYEEHEEGEEWGNWGQFVVDDAIISQIFFHQPKLAQGTLPLLETHISSLSCHKKNSSRVVARQHDDKMEEEKEEKKEEANEENLSCPPPHRLLPPNYILVSEIIASSMKRQQADFLNVEDHNNKEKNSGDGGGEEDHDESNACAAPTPSPPTSFSSLPVNHEEEEEEKTIFPSYPCSRVGELLREVSEGKRPMYALCPPEYVYGTAEYIRECKK